MSVAELERRLEVGAQVARIAGALALDFFRHRELLTIEAKGRQDLVSRADREVEALIRRELSAAFPGDVFLGEEGGGAEAERLWVIDPIDGTFNFLRGIPCWAVVLAWVERGRTLLGITYDPVQDELFTARRSYGATRNGAPIRVASTPKAEEGVVGVTFSFKQPTEDYLAMLGRLIGQGFEHRRIGSTAMKLCYVADGRLDGMITQSCNSWDAVAGLLTVEEAGGRATDFVRQHGLLSRGGVIAAAPQLAGAVQEASGLSYG